MTSPAGELDLDAVRACFPALAAGEVFFDNAGGSQTLKVVVDRLADYLLSTDVQLGASYFASQRAGARFAEGTAAIARWVNAADPDEIVMGPSTTVLLATLAEAIAPSLEPGDEIVVTDQDHESNIGPWARLAEAGHARLRWWKVRPDTGRLELEDLDELLSERTRLVAVTHASNIVGEINPVAEIARRAHACGAEICVDGVALAPHRQVDVQGLDVDYYAISLYKVFGPHVAMLYGRRACLEPLPSLNHYFIGLDEIPYKLQPGHPNYELTYCMTGLWDYVDVLSNAHGFRHPSPQARLQDLFARVAQHEERLAVPLLEFLRGRSDVKIIGPEAANADLRVPVISFAVEGRRSPEIVEPVDAFGIGIRHGDFYAARLIDALGLREAGGVVRVSMAHYNTTAEVDRLIGALLTAL